MEKLFKFGTNLLLDLQIKKQTKKNELTLLCIKKHDALHWIFYFLTPTQSTHKYTTYFIYSSMNFSKVM